MTFLSYLVSDEGEGHLLLLQVVIIRTSNDLAEVEKSGFSLFIVATDMAVDYVSSDNMTK